MNVDQMEGEWEELKGKIQAKWGDGSHHGLDVTSGHGKLIHENLHQIFGMTREQAEKAVADLDESKRK